jgi:hypothetical protein
MVETTLHALRRTALALFVTGFVTGCGDADSSSADATTGEPDAAADAAETEADDARVPGDDTALPELDAGPLNAPDSASQSDAGNTRSDAASGDAAAEAPRVDRSMAKLQEFALDPHMLDPTTAESPAMQYAQLDTRTAPLGKLVVFLPGANNVPNDWRNHGRKLAEYGFHVLIPSYNNRWSSDSTCDGKGNSCADDTRWEALVGEDSSSAVSIARADSAEGRVLTMLKHLVSAHPGGDWGYFLGASGELAYGKSIIAGISHGAASAGMYAARRPFTRNVMHSSGPAGSASAAKMTPLSAWYGFAHTADPAYSAIIGSWNSFNLAGQPTSIDGQQPPFGNSHRLITSAMSSYPHGSVAVHSSSPKDASGALAFEAAWRTLYGVPAP